MLYHSGGSGWERRGLPVRCLTPGCHFMACNSEYMNMSEIDVLLKSKKLFGVYADIIV